MMRLAPIALGITLVIAAPAAFACVCVKGPVKHGFVNADAVFVGRAVAVQNDGGTLQTTFEVSESFKGGAAKQAVIVTENLTSCGMDYEIGTAYLVFASAEAGVLRDSLCSHTDLASNEDKVRLVRKRSWWWRSWLGSLFVRRR